MTRQPLAPALPNKPRTSKRITDRQLWTRLRGVRKSLFLRGLTPDQMTDEDTGDVLRVFRMWCEDWTPKEGE